MLLCWLWTPPLQAAELQAARLIDPANQLDISQLLSLPETSWQVSRRDHTFGVLPDKSAWLRLGLPASLPEQAYLVILRANLDEVCLFTAPERSPQCIQGHVLSSGRDFNSTEPIFALTPDLAGQSVYLRVRSRNHISLPLEVLSKSQLASRILLKQTLDFGAMGTIFSLAFLNLVLAFWLKERIYAWQALASFAWGIYWFGSLLGYSSFWGNPWQGIFAKMPNLIGSLALMGFLFAYQIFAEQELNRHAHRFLWLVKWLLLLSMLTVLARNAGLSLWLARFWGTCIPLGTIVGLCWSLKTRKYLSAFYLSCWFAFYGSTLFIILIQLEVFAFYYFSYSIFSWLQCLSMLSLILVLAIKIQLLRQSQQNLLLSNLQLIETHKQSLELQVAERTEALEQSLKSLAEADQSKNRLFTILAHDLRSPFHSLVMTLRLIEKKSGLLDQNLQTMLTRCKHQIMAISASLDNMLTWAQAEIKGYPVAKTRIQLAELLHEIRSLYASAAEQKKLSFKVLMTGNPVIDMDPHHAHLILRNLVNNAIKFTGQGEIKLGAAEQDEQVLVFIEDTGIGMSPEEIAKVLQSSYSRSGTQGEKGLGLGMPLCLAYLKANQGQLLIHSQKAKGTRIELRFPKPSQAEN